MPKNFLAPPSQNAFNGMGFAPPKSLVVDKDLDEEKMFQSWIRSTPWFLEFVNKYKEEPNLDSKDYDYRAAWKAGIQPERDPYDGNSYHWPSSLPDGKMLKAPDHPTAWKEYFMRDTGQNPDALGLASPQDADIYLKTLRNKR
jgi:hypothetical protein